MDHATRLALAARRGDTAALDSLVDSCYGPLWRFCAAMAGTAEAEDLVQEAFLRALRALPGFRGDSSALTWLMGIARHTYLDHARREARDRRGHRELGRWPLDHATSGPEERLAVLDLVRRLEPDRRTAFVLTQVLGFGYEDAARVCACPIGTIRSRIARARSELISMSRVAEDERAMPGRSSRPF